ncbi:hypothetical protein CBW65_22460 [Tumebacillus avium]|uniref:Uncharacterized protein n=1 Tax=Tumebacillus avium TaxID=1903704 RepID=A0A1Y0IT26_9BACL|nr:hypothetical protein [Tumebacillus avium]ARU63450.1 hypothetical protein CBW65_22460 [Tumebacillus avium]
MGLNLMDWLDRCSKERLQSITKILYIEAPGQTVGYMKNKIADYLLDSKKLDKILQTLEPNLRETLRHFALIGEKRIGGRYGVYLETLGILHEGVMPDDLFELMQHALLDVTTRFDDVIIAHQPSPFLNLVLYVSVLLNCDMKLKYNTPKNRSNSHTKIMEKSMIYTDQNLSHIFKYMLQKGFYEIYEGEMICNSTKVQQWFDPGSQASEIREFYNFLLRRRNAENLNGFLEKLSTWQNSIDDWVLVDVLLSSLSGAASIEKIESFGLIRFHSHEGKMYAQLTPEAWLLTKDDYPLVWREKQMLLSADYDLLIPYTFDPFIIAMALKYADLSSNDVFLVFDIYKVVEKTEPSTCVQNFVKEVIERTVKVPNVVDYEFQRILSA